MGWIPFIVALIRLILSIWVPKRKEGLVRVKTVAKSLVPFGLGEMRKRVDSLCPLGECLRGKGGFLDRFHPQD